MVSPVDLLGLALLVLVHTAVAALLTRFFRVRLVTRAGSAVYTLTAIPVVLLGLTLVFGGVLGLGPDLGSPGAVIALTVLLPMALGISFDYFWMPSPAEVDLPTAREESRRRSQEFRRKD
jgi:hypothetical protein